MLFERQRVLLTLLDALGGQVSPTDFQKLLFLYTRKQETPNCYDEWSGGVSNQGRDGKREVVLTGRLKPALYRLNPRLPAEALDAAVEEFGRDFLLSARSLALRLGAAGLFERNPGTIRKSLTNSEFLFKSKTSA